MQNNFPFISILVISCLLIFQSRKKKKKIFFSDSQALPIVIKVITKRNTQARICRDEFLLYYSQMLIKSSFSSDSVI